MMATSAADRSAGITSPAASGWPRRRLNRLKAMGLATPSGMKPAQRAEPGAHAGGAVDEEVAPALVPDEAAELRRLRVDRVGQRGIGFGVAAAAELHLAQP